MAEVFLNEFYGDSFKAFSAGTEPGKMNSYVVEVMSELGFDLSRNQTKSVKEFIDQQIDLVVTVCNRAKESCPFLPGAKNYLHHSFTDPSEFTGSEEEILNKVREIRDEIKKWIEENFGDKNE
jgi:arsenate reductase